MQMIALDNSSNNENTNPLPHIMCVHPNGCAMEIPSPTTLQCNFNNSSKKPLSSFGEEPVSFSHLQQQKQQHSVLDNDYFTLTKRDLRQRAKSQVRAQALSVLYELGNNKKKNINCFSRNKNNENKEDEVTLYKMATKISAVDHHHHSGSTIALRCCTAKQAVALHAHLQAQTHQKKALILQTDPLLTTHERKKEQHKLDVQQNIVKLNALLSPASQLSNRAPFGLVLPSLQAHATTITNRSASGGKLANDSTVKGGKLVSSLSLTSLSLNHDGKSGQGCGGSCTEKKNAIDFVCPPNTPGHVSLASTTVETPSPIAFRASNGKRYVVPNLC